MNAHEVAVAAIESRRSSVNSHRKGVTYLAAFIVLLVHLHPFANGTYTNEQLVIRIAIGLLIANVLARLAEWFYLDAHRRNIERRINAAIAQMRSQTVEQFNDQEVPSS
ncbi:MAG TPA: hypothetical protein DEB38_03380 [Acidimicrobiaceae bacterium]|nr:hypothetical protein [Acidimicrobiaceae bacterium]|tara:strand:+ start:270 stop:596 length:327 start_codon:yes stop_codon:yes gene_type:complete